MMLKIINIDVHTSNTLTPYVFNPKTPTLTLKP